MQPLESGLNHIAQILNFKKMNTKSIIAVVLIILVVIFTIQNTQIVTIKFLFWELSMSRILIIAGSFIIGFLSAFLIFSQLSRKQKLTKHE